MPESVLRSGVTTGACAAAAAQAAMFAWQGVFPADATITTPTGVVLTIPVECVEALPTGGRATVVKEAGDDPDITNGVRIIVEVQITKDETGIRFFAGEGIGRVTLPGLQIPVGDPAINPVPRRMIAAAIQPLLGSGMGADVTISIPGGTELAQRTLNPALGIEGGLSVIGTTGVVEPMSEEAFRQSLKPQIAVAMAQGYASLVFVPGKIGQEIAILKYGLPKAAVVQTSNFVGFMLESAVAMGAREILLFGHLGKLVKVAAGVFHTHNRMADARMETLAAYAALYGAPQEAIQAIMACVTTEAVLPVFNKYGLDPVFANVAQRASERALRYVFDEIKVGTAVVNMQGVLLGADSEAYRIGGGMGWTVGSQS